MLKSYIPSRLYHSVTTLASYRQVSLKQLEARYAVYKVAAGPYLTKAKRLHANVYLYYGFITVDDLAEGMMTIKADPYQQHAEYFVAVDRQTDDVVALIRQIHQRRGAQLPVLRHRLSNKSYSHVHRNDIVELSAFAKQRGVDSRVTLLLFRELLLHSSQQGHQYWVFACDKKVYARLKTLFGGLLKRTGPTTFYMGSDVVPAEIELDYLARQLRRSYRHSLPPLRSVRRFLYASFRPVAENSKATLRQLSRTYFWDQYARTYDGLLHLAPYRHLIDHVSDLALVDRPKRVLDLGCGTGNVAIRILEKDKDVRVDAVDWSRVMLRRLIKKTQSNRLMIRNRDVINFLASTRRHYDMIVLNNVVYTIDDRDRFWKLIASRLQENGRVVISHPDTPNSQALLQDHIKQQSFISLLKPRLILVGLFDAIISLLGMSNKYEFTPKDELLEELARYELVPDGPIGRCYGGHECGIDLLFTVKKRQDKV